ncbi:unnamed protein product [Rhizopus stolonifer]
MFCLFRQFCFKSSFTRKSRILFFSTQKDSIQLGTKRFDQFQLSKNTQRILKKTFQYETMSLVQEAVLDRLETHNNFNIKAKAGQGKTLAYLITALEKTQSDNLVLIVAPTNLSATHIADQARKLVQGTKRQVHCLVSTESPKRQLQYFERWRMNILVSTPLRLNKLLSLPDFRTMCEKLKMLVTDDLDGLETRALLDQLPAPHTLVFSNKRFQIKDRLWIDNFREGQIIRAMVAPYAKQFALIRKALDDSGKTLVFLPTTEAVWFYADLFKRMVQRPVFDLDSRGEEGFRQSRDGILFVSDLGGLEFSDVSQVIQIGHCSREQCVDRMSIANESLIVLAPFERDFLNQLSDIQIRKIVPRALEPEETRKVKNELRRAGRLMDKKTLKQLHQAYVNYYTTIHEPKVVKKEADEFLQAIENV